MPRFQKTLRLKSWGNRSFVLVLRWERNIARRGRAKSNADFISKLEGELQELDETLYWLELIGESEVISKARLEPLEQETQELIAMFVSMVKGVKQEIAMHREKGIIPHPSALIP